MLYLFCYHLFKCVGNAQTSDPEVQCSNPARGGILFKTVQHFIAQSVSIQCSSNISRSLGSRVRYRNINGARYKSCMYNGVHNTRSVCRCGSLLRHHG